MESDWYEAKFKSTNEPYRYTVAHWCATEARFRNHLKKIKKEDAEKLIPLENMLVRITQQDVVYRRYLVPDHRSYVPDFGVYIKVQGPNGDVEYRSMSRQLVLFCVERRKAWRMLQSKAGIENRGVQGAAVDSGGCRCRKDFEGGAVRSSRRAAPRALESADRPGPATGHKLPSTPTPPMPCTTRPPPARGLPRTHRPGGIIRGTDDLPVVEHEQVVGIVSIGDPVRQVASTQSEMIQQLQEYISGRPFEQPAP